MEITLYIEKKPEFTPLQIGACSDASIGRWGGWALTVAEEEFSIYERVITKQTN